MEPTSRPRFRWLRLTPDRVVPGLLALEGLLLLAERFGWFTFDRHKGYAPLVAIAAVGAVFVLMLLWFMVALVFRRRFQFSLRSLFLLVVVVSIPCSWLSTEMKAAREQHAAVVAIEKLGGVCAYDYRMGEMFDPPVPAPAWLSEWLGDDLLANVTAVVPAISNSVIGDSAMDHVKGFTRLQLLELHKSHVSDAGLENIKGLTQLQTLDLRETYINDAGLEYLEGLTQLKWLDLECNKIGDAGLEHLKGLSKLKYLNLNDTNVGDAGLEHILGLSQLEALRLGGTKITDAGMSGLKGLPKLIELDLDETNVSDAGLERLKGMTQLQVLNLFGTTVSDAGVRKLQAALPKTLIERDIERWRHDF